MSRWARQSKLLKNILRENGTCGSGGLPDAAPAISLKVSKKSGDAWILRFTCFCSPGDKLRRVELNPETYRHQQARAWKAKTEAARVRHELDLTQNAFAEMLSVSLATVRKWERGTCEPSGAAKTLLAVARLNPEVIKEAVAIGK